jgi:hypothetical protein
MKLAPGPRFRCGCGSIRRMPTAAVPIQNLNPDILMMEPAEDWHCFNAADLLSAESLE